MSRSRRLAFRRARVQAPAARRKAAPVSSQRVNKGVPYRTACNSVNRLPQYAPTRPISLMNPKPKTVLIVDDDEGMRDTIAAILKWEYRVLRVATSKAALPILNCEDVDLMLLDVRLPHISGFEVLRIVKENYSLVEVMMISAISEIETAVQAMKHSAHHYITKDFDYDQLRSLMRNASERQDLNRQVLTLSAQVADQTEREFVIGPSRITRDIVDLVNKIAKLSATVLILGESGTSKELLVRLIHREAGDPTASSRTTSSVSANL